MRNLPIRQLGLSLLLACGIGMTLLSACDEQDQPEPAPDEAEPTEEELISEAEMEVQQVKEMIETYYMSEGELPAELEDLTKGPVPITEELPVDPWGNPYVYEQAGEREFDVFSVGPDEEKGTTTDIHPDE